MYQEQVVFPFDLRRGDLVKHPDRKGRWYEVRQVEMDMNAFDKKPYKVGIRYGRSGGDWIEWRAPDSRLKDAEWERVTILRKV